jgi:hypothetical protein
MTDNTNDALILMANGKTEPVKDDIISMIENAPDFSMRTIMLLQRMNSPFTRAPEIDRSETGEVIMENGKLALRKTIPTMEEALQAWWIIINQARPDILRMIQSKDILDNVTYDLASKIKPSAIGAIVKAINEKISSVNQAASSIDSGDAVDSSPEKKGSGPTP